jgi:hypothetical protein
VGRVAREIVRLAAWATKSKSNKLGIEAPWRDRGGEYSLRLLLPRGLSEVLSANTEPKSS